MHYDYPYLTIRHISAHAVFVGQSQLSKLSLLGQAHFIICFPTLN